MLVDVRSRARLNLALVPLASLALACGGGAATTSGGAGGAGGAGGGCPVDVEPEAPLVAPPIHTPRWAFEPWISKDISDDADTRAFVRGFRDRDIPVGVVVLDSPWETNYNTFVPNPDRYPGFADLVSDLRAQDIRLVLWVTQFVNSTSFDFEVGGDVYQLPAPNHAEGQACGFFVDGGVEYGWWKGLGGAVDFFHPSARAWWHAQQDALLELGVAGWKLDFGDSYVTSDPVETFEGPVAHQQYSERYYEDFYAYGASKLGTDEFVTMVRPWDESYQFEGRFFARKEHAPVAWVGDNRHDFVGLSDALDHIFRSAAAGYVVLGSDVGGYLDLDDVTFAQVPFERSAFHSWVALGALSPFMQLHGRENLAPWTVPGGDPEESVAIYRFWATLHHELVPFFYSAAEEAYASGGVLVAPEGAPESWPGDYRYVLGDAFLVAPVLDGTGSRDVELPEGIVYYPFFDDAADPIAGGQVVTVDTSNEAEVPLFWRSGAIVSLRASSDLTTLAPAEAAGSLVLALVPGESPSQRRLHDEDGQQTEVGLEADGAGLVTVTLTRRVEPMWLRVRADVMPTTVSLDGAPLPEAASTAALGATGWVADPARRLVWVKLEASTLGTVVTLDP